MTELPVNGEPKATILAAIASLRRWTVILYVALAVVALTTFIVRSYDLAHVEQNANQNRTALCALREDLHRRVQSSVRFLENNPGGITGISGAEIRESIRNQRATIHTLKVIDCSEVVIAQ